MTARAAIVALMSALLLTGFQTPAPAAAAFHAHRLITAAAPFRADRSAAASFRADRLAAAAPFRGDRVSAAAPLRADRLTAAALGAVRADRLAAAAFRADRPTAAELDKHIAAASRRLEVVVEQYNDSREDLHTTQVRISHLNSRLGPMTRDLEQQQVLVDGLMSNTYQRTRTGPTVALFASDEPHEFVDKLLVLHQLASSEQRATEALRRAQSRVNGTRQMLNALADQQRRQQTQLNTRRATVKGEIVALKQMRVIAYGGGSRYTDMGDIPVPDYVPGPAGQAVAFAFAQLGKPYRWGADGPRAYDCSGLTLAAWRTAGVDLPHNAARQYASTAHIGRGRLKPGDLVFFYGPISHVGIYIGGGKMIHAPEFGENVRVASIDSQPIAGFARPA